MAKTKQDEVIKEEIIERSQAIFNNEEEFKKFDPFTYDGSYELVQTAVSLYDREQNFDNLSNEDFALLNQLSGITVSLDTYKEKVYKNEVHLSQRSKDELFVKIQQVWKKSEEKKFNHNARPKKVAIGMFNLATRSFENTPQQDVKFLFMFICSCAKNIIKREYLDRLSDGKIGVNYGTLSQILHCANPGKFPILNSAGRTLYTNVGIELLNKSIKLTFLDDCERINNFCEENGLYHLNKDGNKEFNYRIIDVVGDKVMKEHNIEIPRDDENDVNINSEENKNSGFFSKSQLPVNMILYGPPGTGKTYNSVVYAVGIIEKWSKEEIEEYIKHKAMPKNAETQQNDKSQTKRIEYSEILKKFNNYKVKHDISDDNTDNGQIEFVTFHQSYGYEEFIEGIKPRTENGEIRYEIADGVFKKFCKKAENNPDKNYVFIIDEINRGNISKIFGELITLIEDTKRIGASEEMRATLPYSGESFGVLDNVYILGTMNTADRSISLMDTALRRRFRFVEMMPNPTLIKANIVIDGKKLNVKEILETMNKRIEYLYDREHTIGHSFFMKLNETKSMDDLKNVMLNSVLPLLQEYFYDDYNKIRLVLGDNQKTDASGETCFVVKKNDNKNDLFGATDEINDTEVFEINEKAFGNADSYKYLLSGTGSPKHDQTGAETSSENN
mgnify:CR=1 FL=1